MNQVLQQLLSQAYELEGMLRVALERDKADLYAIELVKKKAELIEATAQQLTDNVEKPVAPAPEEEPEIDVPDDPKEFDFDVPDEEEPKEMDFDIPDEDEPKEMDFDVPDDEEPKEMDFDVPDDADEPKEMDFDVPDDADEPEIPDVPEEEEPEIYQQDQYRLGDRLERDISRGDLRRAFTLNDRFRFRRELFENSDVQMNEALDLVAAMTSLEEAEEYFYGDCGWDKESEEVNDFMEIIRRHFN